MVFLRKQSKGPVVHKYWNDLLESGRHHKDQDFLTNPTASGWGTGPYNLVNRSN